MMGLNTERDADMSKPYTYIQDPGHGWLKVPLAELQDLGLMDLISGHSSRGETVAYLEEDCDMGLFLAAKHRRGELVEIVSKHVKHFGRGNYFPSRPFDSEAVRRIMLDNKACYRPELVRWVDA